MIKDKKQFSMKLVILAILVSLVALSYFSEYSSVSSFATSRITGSSVEQRFGVMAAAYGDFDWRSPINITETSGKDLSSYQINITADTQSLIAAGKMNSSCKDIRFTNSTSFDSSDWTINYSYWIEEGCNTTSTRFWVKVDSIPASATKNIYMYYGNNSISAGENGTETFPIFFYDMSYDPTGDWIYTYNWGDATHRYHSLVNDFNNVNITQGRYRHKHRLNWVQSRNWAGDGKMGLTDGADSGASAYGTLWAGNFTLLTDRWNTDQGATDSQTLSRHYVRNSTCGAISVDQRIPGYSEGNNYITEQRWAGTAADYVIWNTAYAQVWKNTHNTCIPMNLDKQVFSWGVHSTCNSGAGYIFSYVAASPNYLRYRATADHYGACAQSDGVEHYFYWMFIANYTSPEPTVILGVEEDNNLPTHSNPILNSSAGTNTTNEDLTCYNQSTSDADGDNVTNIYNWYLNDTPIMIGYWPFDSDDSGGAGVTKDYSGYGNDGAENGGVIWNSTGQIGGAYTFDASNDYINPGMDIWGDITLAAWVYYNGNDAGAIYGNYHQSHAVGDTDSILCSVYPWGGIVYSIDDGTSLVTTKNLSGGWNHLVFQHGAAGMNIYINGTLNASNAVAINLDTRGAHSYWAGGPGVIYPYIGEKGYSFIHASYSDSYNGSIDDFRIYNSTLSAAQIAQLYQDTKDGYSSSQTIVSEETSVGENYTCEVTPSDGLEDGTTKNSSTLIILGDTTAPTISIISPQAAETYIINSTWFNISANEALSWCGYSLNLAANVTMTSYNATHYYNNTNLTDGIHNVTVHCNDTSGNMGQSALVTFYIDTVPPAIDLDFPVNFRYLTYGNITFNYTPHPNGGALDTCRLYGNWSTGWHINQTNSTINASIPNYFNTTIEEGTHFWNVWCNDSGGNSDFAPQNQTFTIDLTPPTVILNYPSSGNVSGSITINSTVTDNTGVNSSRVYYQLSNTSGSQTAWTAMINLTSTLFNTSFDTTTLADGYYNITINASDIAYNVNSTERVQIRIVQDNIVPIVNLETPQDGSTIGYAVVTFGYNVTDVVSDIRNCSVWTNSTGIWALNTTNSTTITEATAGQQINVANLAEGTIIWNVQCYDTASVSNMAFATNNYTAIKDTTAPTIALSAPSDGYASTTTTLGFEYSVTDFSNIASCSLIINNAVDQTDTTITKSTAQTFTQTLSAGTHTWSINCTDAVGNTNASGSRSLTISLPAEEASTRRGGIAATAPTAPTTTGEAPTAPAPTPTTPARTIPPSEGIIAPSLFGAISEQSRDPTSIIVTIIIIAAVIFAVLRIKSNKSKKKLNRSIDSRTHTSGEVKPR